MKTLTTIFVLFLALTTLSFQSKKIKSVTVYKVERGKNRYIGVNEYNIKKNVTATKYEVTNAECLEQVEKGVKNLNEAKTIKTIGAIYALCEVHYTDASVQTIAFEDAKPGYIKMGTKVYYQSPVLSSSILFCK